MCLSQTSKRQMLHLDHHKFRQIKALINLTFSTERKVRLITSFTISKFQLSGMPHFYYSSWNSNLLFQNKKTISDKNNDFVSETKRYETLIFR